LNEEEKVLNLSHERENESLEESKQVVASALFLPKQEYEFSLAPFCGNSAEIQYM